MEPHWHILRTRSGREAEASAAIPSWVPSYFPTQTVSRFNRRMRRWIRSTVPMLPGYIFVDTDNPVTVSLSPNAAVIGFMRNGDRSFSSITLRALDAVRLLERDFASGWQGLNHPHRPGDHVEVSIGASVRMRAVVEELQGESEAVLRILESNSALASRLTAHVSKVRALAA